MPASVSVSERNDASTSSVSGSVRPTAGTFSVLGVSLAGQAEAGVGTAFQGVYGTLSINANGSFTYRLDNADTDTNLLGSGQMVEERFTYTFNLDGGVSTNTIVVRISGLDEPGQQIEPSEQTIVYSADTTVGSLTRLMPGDDWGARIGLEATDIVTLTHNGAIHVGTVDSPEALGVIVEARGALVNNGLIEAVSGSAGHGTTAVLAGGVEPIINNGVIRAVASAVPDQGFGGRSVGVYSYYHGETIINTGMIEVISEHGEAFGIWNRGLFATIDNSGLIYVSGGSSDDPLGVVGIRSGQSTDYLINNSGTIHVVSSDPDQPTVGISIFPDSSSNFSIATIVNSGTIVADTAIAAHAAYLISTHVTNSGRIEGNLLLDWGYNIVRNEAGAIWLGDFELGVHHDELTNTGLIQGDVDLHDGHDFFDGRLGSVEGTVGGGTGMDLLWGSAGADALHGGDGNDLIFGGAGADELSGGGGGDIFVYKTASDSASTTVDTISDFTSGVDKIDVSALAPSSVSFISANGFTNIEIVGQGGTTIIRVAGSVSQSDIIVSTKQDLFGSSGADLLYSGDRPTVLAGLSGDDLLVGGAGADNLDGGAGADVMRGGSGDDLYHVDDSGDLIGELSGGGYDSVEAATDFVMSHDLEELLLLSGTYGTGNDQSNRITGNGADNILDGRGGDDILIGRSGNDRYLVDSSGDQVVEAMSEGVDTVTSSASFTLGANVENLILAQTLANTSRGIVGDLAGTGNALDNIILGNEGANLIAGEAGADQLYGDDGDDEIVGGDGDDYLEGGSGVDVLNGGAGDDRLVAGNAPVWDQISGGYYVPGVATTDLLNGGSGHDIFIFHRIEDSLVSTPVMIGDYNPAEDIIDLSAIDADVNQDGHQEFTVVQGGFTGQAGELYMSDAQGGSATLFADVDGDGQADMAIALRIVTTPPVPAVRAILTEPGEDLTIGSTYVSLIGTKMGGEEITVISGNVRFDASFNTGGDTIILPGISSTYTVHQQGSQAILTSGEITISVPAGVAGMSILFEDGSLDLRIDTAQGVIRLGEQELTATPATVDSPSPEASSPLSVMEAFNIPPTDVEYGEFQGIRAADFLETEISSILG